MQGKRNASDHQVCQAHLPGCPLVEVAMADKVLGGTRGALGQLHRTKTRQLGAQHRVLYQGTVTAFCFPHLAHALRLGQLVTALCGAVLVALLVVPAVSGSARAVVALCALAP